jgi:hypothetical protein
VKTIIAIMSCHAHRSFEQAQRDTWIKCLPPEVDYRFFIGRPIINNGEPDEVFLDTPDDYNSLSCKSVAMIKWILEHEYDFEFKCDVDTLVIPSRLMGSGFEKHDYAGGLGCGFASGGSGYWLSAKAMQAVLQEPAPTPSSREDVFIADALRKHNISLHDDRGYEYAPGCGLNNSTITYHLSSVFGWEGGYTPNMMYENWESAKQMELV